MTRKNKIVICIAVAITIAIPVSLVELSNAYVAHRYPHVKELCK